MPWFEPNRTAFSFPSAPAHPKTVCQQKPTSTKHVETISSLRQVVVARETRGHCMNEPGFHFWVLCTPPPLQLLGFWGGCCCCCCWVFIFLLVISLFYISPLNLFFFFPFKLCVCLTWTLSAALLLRLIPVGPQVLSLPVELSRGPSFRISVWGNPGARQQSSLLLLHISHLLLRFEFRKW